jgi:hypothetical protein
MKAKCLLIAIILMFSYMSPTSANPSSIVVQPNDTLASISFKVYGTHKFWRKIYKANQNTISDPNIIFRGIVLEIPSLVGRDAHLTQEVINKVPEKLDGVEISSSNLTTYSGVEKPTESSIGRDPASVPIQDLKSFKEMELPEL